MNQATYCPEDNKLRLYVGRVPRDEYLKLRADGWTSTPKQSCDFVATWTPSRRDTALEYAGIIEDEDQTPEDRAADRAERFGDYREKRTAEATGHADTFDQGPAVHGFQSARRAEASARRHDRTADRACDAWSKAEYWQRRTAGVIAHALYRSAPGVRMGRIKVLEAELRKAQADIDEARRRFLTWTRIGKMTDAEEQTAAAERYAGSNHFWWKYPHPVTGKESDLWDMLRRDRENRITGAQAAALYLSNHSEPAEDNDWTLHLKLRLGYENQMLEAQGGRAAFVEMEAGGWLGKHQIRKVNKSPATGRVVSVTLKIPGDRWGNTKEGYHLRAFNIERLPSDAYTPPTEADKASLTETKLAEKAAAPKIDCPLINPTDDDADRLQEIWNAKHPKGTRQSPLRMTQGQYSANSGGTYSACETITLTEHGTEARDYSAMRIRRYRAKVCKVRTGPAAANSDHYSARRVIILTDKPQKPIPFSKMEALRASFPSPETMRPKIPAIQAQLANAWLDKMDQQLIDDAVYVGWIYVASMSQVYWTDEGKAALDEFKKAGPLPALVEASELFALES